MQSPQDNSRQQYTQSVPANSSGRLFVQIDKDHGRFIADGMPAGGPPSVRQGGRRSREGTSGPAMDDLSLSPRGAQAPSSQATGGETKGATGGRRLFMAQSEAPDDRQFTKSLPANASGSRLFIQMNQDHARFKPGH
jgi:hypothetical protein